MNNMDLCELSATALAGHIRRKTVSPVEAAEAALARIEAVNPRLNCFCFVYGDEARDAARAAEKAVMAGAPLGPLHGVPIAFKDMTPMRGRRTTLGSHIFENWIPDHDAVVVERLAAAGAIVVGKTTTSEFAATSFTETKLWGITRNPWNTDRTPGGSSGGSGAAVASRCVPLAEGCDMGGSVRIPASFCGTVGLKPSFGRIPFDILPSQFDTYCHFGPLARSVADAALFLDAAQGHDDRDILSLPGRLAIPNPLPHDVSGLRLALSVDLGYYAVDPEVEAGVRAAADTFRSLGAAVEEVALPWTRAITDAGYEHWNAYLAAYAAQYLPEWRDRMDPVLVKIIEDGLKMDAVAFKKIEIVRTRQWEGIRPVFRAYDALLCPTMSVPAPPVGTTDFDFLYDDEHGRFHQFEMTFPFNMISPCPALSIPCGLTRDGLPIGLQVVGRPYDDLMPLRLGAALETTWEQGPMKPPI